MGQVSRPLLVVLGATVCMAMLWLIALRPGEPPVDKTPSGPAALPAAAQGQAQAAVDASVADAAQKEAAAAAVDPAAAPATATPAAPATPASAPEPEPVAQTKPGDPSGPLLAQLGKGKVVVVVFRGEGADDQAAVRAVRAAKSSRIVTHSASIDDVGKYEAITAGVQVLSAPTVLVIGPDRKAHTVTGFTDVAEIRQLAADAR